MAKHPVNFLREKVLRALKQKVPEIVPTHRAEIRCKSSLGGSPTLDCSGEGSESRQPRGQRSLSWTIQSTSAPVRVRSLRRGFHLARAQVLALHRKTDQRGNRERPVIRRQVVCVGPRVIRLPTLRRVVITAQSDSDESSPRVTHGMARVKAIAAIPHTDGVVVVMSEQLTLQRSDTGSPVRQVKTIRLSRHRGRIEECKYKAAALTARARVICHSPKPRFPSYIVQH
jgi:hypothetical protein